MNLKWDLRFIQKPTRYTFSYFYKQNFVLFTMVPRNTIENYNRDPRIPTMPGRSTSGFTEQADMTLGGGGISNSSTLGQHPTAQTKHIPGTAYKTSTCAARKEGRKEGRKHSRSKTPLQVASGQCTETLHLLSDTTAV